MLTEAERGMLTAGSQGNLDKKEESQILFTSMRYFISLSLLMCLTGV